VTGEHQAQQLSCSRGVTGVPDWRPAPGSVSSACVLVCRWAAELQPFGASSDCWCKIGCMLSVI
jgi:hypothetical protein